MSLMTFVSYHQTTGEGATPQTSGGGKPYNLSLDNDISVRKKLANSTNNYYHSDKEV
jgi:hypothetical protein